MNFFYFIYLIFAQVSWIFCFYIYFLLFFNKFYYIAVIINSPFFNFNLCIYIQNFESATEKLKLKNNNSEIKYDWEKKLEKIYSDISNFRINREDLSRVSYLKKGYPLSLEDFLKIFKQ